MQESVLAGVWRVQYLDQQQHVLRDTIEVADAPMLVRDLCFAGEAAENIDPSGLDIPDNVYNAPAAADRNQRTSCRSTGPATRRT